MKPQRNSQGEAVSMTTFVFQHRNPLARFFLEQPPNGWAKLSFTRAADEGQPSFVPTKRDLQGSLCADRLRQGVAREARSMLFRAVVVRPPIAPGAGIFAEGCAGDGLQGRGD